MPRARISAFLVLFTARVPYATSHTHDDEFFFHFQFILQGPIIIVETGDHLGIRPHFLTTGTDEL